MTLNGVTMAVARYLGGSGASYILHVATSATEIKSFRRRKV